MFSTYKPEDVTILLKNISGLVEPLDTATRERAIQTGEHYSSMLPLEYEPSAEYMSVYRRALKDYAAKTAAAVAATAEKIWLAKRERAVLVSLARAGTSIGILVKRYLQKKYRVNAPHYTISIIRGIGIDHNAMKFILSRHAPDALQFIDGWIGKGAIVGQLRRAMEDYPGVSSEIAVLSDPAYITRLYGTREDFLIPSSCLNSTVSGLLSRTFLRDDIIGANDFHGAAFYDHLKAQDLTYRFIETVEAHFAEARPNLDENSVPDGRGLREVKEIGREFGIDDVNLIKPGIGETTRVLLRRVPRVILVGTPKDEAALKHIYRLAAEKNVAVIEYPLKNYRACGLIQKLGDT